MELKKRNKRISRMCREILDADEPFYWNYDLSKREKDLAIDFLLRTVLGYSEPSNSGEISLEYIEEKFFSAYNKITKKKVYPH